MTTTTPAVAPDIAFNGNSTLHTGHNTIFWESEFKFWRVMKYDADGNVADWADGEDGDRSEDALRATLAAADVTIDDSQVASLLETARLHMAVLDEDGEVIAECRVASDAEAIDALWPKFRTDVGPLSERPATLEGLGDALAAVEASLVEGSDL